MTFQTTFQLITMNKNTFCILPWVHTHLNTEGDVFPCCVSWDPDRTARVGWLKDNTLEELFNNDFMKQLRLDMLNGVERNDVCKNCISREIGGFVSARQGYNNDFKDQIEHVIKDTRSDGYVTPIIKSWDIRFSNLCNLKCRSCGPLFSTSWAHEQGLEQTKIFAINDDSIDPLESQYDNVEKIYFAGGEPLIMPEHFRTLNKLIDNGNAKNIQLVYNSNLTKLNYNHHNLLEYWSHFKKIVIGVSIDAIGSRAEYIRHGVAWKHIEDNLKTLITFKEQSQTFDFYFSPTVSILNVYHLCDMHRYLWENKLMPHIDAIMFNMLLAPDHYDCRILPDDIKKIIIEKITEHEKWLTDNRSTGDAITQFLNLKSYLSQEFSTSQLSTFFLKTNILDKTRNENFKETFPEYAKLYEE